MNVWENEIWLPILGAASAAYAVIEAIANRNVTKKTVFEFLVGAAILFFSINDNVNNTAEKRQNDSLSAKQDADILKVQDTLRRTRDSLLTIGLKIDKTTGRIEVVDSKILKAVLKLQPPVMSAGIPDSLNYVTVLYHDTLMIYPKEGSWAHGYIAFDTTNSKEFENKMFMGIGPATEVDKINVNGKTYLTHIYSAFSVATHKGHPWELSMSNSLNRYIIFGEDGVGSKRYFYRNGKVKWIPE